MKKFKEGDKVIHKPTGEIGEFIRYVTETLRVIVSISTQTKRSNWVYEDEIELYPKPIVEVV